MVFKEKRKKAARKPPSCMNAGQSMLLLETELGGNLRGCFQDQRDEFLLHALGAETHGRAGDAGRADNAAGVIANRRAYTSIADIQFFVIHGIDLLSHFLELFPKHVP